MKNKTSMQSLTLSKYKPYCIALIIFIVGFTVGLGAERLSNYKENHIIFANIIGDEILTVNRMYSAYSNEKAQEIVLDYNMRILETIGCSEWLKLLTKINKSDKELFLNGVNVAFSNIGTTKSNYCIGKLKLAVKISNQRAKGRL